jgi:hypothetical protein
MRHHSNHISRSRAELQSTHAVSLITVQGKSANVQLCETDILKPLHIYILAKLKYATSFKVWGYLVSGELSVCSQFGGASDGSLP